MSIASALRFAVASSFVLFTASACQSSSDVSASEPISVEMLQDTPRGDFSLVKSRTFQAKPVAPAAVAKDDVEEVEEVVVVEEAPVVVASNECNKPIVATSEHAVANPCLTTERFAMEMLNFTPKQFARVQKYEKMLERRSSLAH